MKSSNERDDLNLEITFLQGLRRRMPDDVEVLRLLGDDYTRIGRLHDGLEVDLQLIRLLPDDAVVRYNLACSLALLGRLKEAARGLRKAVELGYSDWDWMTKDPDLEDLRNSGEFAPVLAWIRSKHNTRSRNSGRG